MTFVIFKGGGGRGNLKHKKFPVGDSVVLMNLLKKSLHVLKV